MSQIRNLPLSLSENWYDSTFPQAATPATLQDYYIHSSTYPMDFHIGEMIREPLTFLCSRFSPHQATLKKSVFSGQSRKNMIIIIIERSVEIFEIEAQNYAEWRVQFRQTQTLI